MRNGDGLLASVLKGALAGAAASWVMGQATTYMYEHEAREARQREDSARGGKMAYETAAEKAAGLFGRKLSEQERKRFGLGIHWGLGVGAGAIYGALRGRVRPADWGAGLLFGTAFWLLVDELGNTALRLTPPPPAFPWQAHARGLIGHLVYGVAADTTLRALDRVA